MITSNPFVSKIRSLENYSIPPNKKLKTLDVFDREQYKQLNDGYIQSSKKLIFKYIDDNLLVYPFNLNEDNKININNNISYLKLSNYSKVILNDKKFQLELNTYLIEIVNTIFEKIEGKLTLKSNDTIIDIINTFNEFKNNLNPILNNLIKPFDHISKVIDNQTGYPISQCEIKIINSFILKFLNNNNSDKLFDYELPKVRNKLMISIFDLLNETLVSEEIFDVNIDIKADIDISSKLKPLDKLILFTRFIHQFDQFVDKDKINFNIDFNSAIMYVVKSSRDELIFEAKDDDSFTDRYIKMSKHLFKACNELGKILSNFDPNIDYLKFSPDCMKVLFSDVLDVSIKIILNLFKKNDTNIIWVYNMFNLMNQEDMKIIIISFKKFIEIEMDNLLINNNLENEILFEKLESLMINYKNILNNNLKDNNNNDQFKLKLFNIGKEVIRNKLGDEKMMHTMNSLVRYIDNNLIKSIKGKSQTPIDTTVELIGSILNDSEIESFFEKYRIFYNKRLLNYYISNDNLKIREKIFNIENSMNKTLSTILNEEQTQNLMTSLKLIDESINQFTEFNQYHEVDFDLNFVCLKEGIFKDPPPNQAIKLPKELSSISESYFHFLNNKSKNRRYDWKLFLHKFTISIQFNDKNSQLIECSIYQLVILIAFQNNDLLSVDKLLAITGMKPSFLIENLKSLSNPKYPILFKTNTGSFKLSENFKCVNRLIKVVPAKITSL